MVTAPGTANARRIKGRLLLLALFLLLLYVVLPQIGSFSMSFDVIGEAKFEQLVAGTVVVACTYVLAAGIYQSLSLKKLPFKRTLLVQCANGFANRLLPAGLGGLTLSVQYLRRSGYSLPQALAIAGANNSLGFIGHGLLLVVAVMTSGGALLHELHLPVVPHAGYIAAGVTAVIAVNLLAFSRLRHYLFRLTTDILGHVAAYRRYPARLFGALLCSVGLTLGYALALYACAQAVGIALSWGTVFVIFTVGIAATAITPTPGGVGGAEAGLVAGMAAYGVDVSLALAATLLYRLLTYWLPILPGFLVLLSIRHKYL